MGERRVPQRSPLRRKTNLVHFKRHRTLLAEVQYAMNIIFPNFSKRFPPVFFLGTFAPRFMQWPHECQYPKVPGTYRKAFDRGDNWTDSRETVFLFQRPSVTYQRFNSVCLADTFPSFVSAT